MERRRRGGVIGGWGGEGRGGGELHGLFFFRRGRRGGEAGLFHFNPGEQDKIDYVSVTWFELLFTPGVLVLSEEKTLFFSFFLFPFIYSSFTFFEQFHGEVTMLCASSSKVIRSIGPLFVRGRLPSSSSKSFEPFHGAYTKVIRCSIGQPRPVLSGIIRLLSSSTRSSPPTPPPPLPPPRYVHVSASGDWWIADELFAAKHMQPGDVVSCEVPGDFTEDMGDGWTGEDMRKAFDTKILPEYGGEGT